jgi:hypothetical protein
LILFTRKDLSQNSTHNLSTSGLGKVRNDEDSFWSSEWTNALPHLKNEILYQLVVELIAVFNGDKCVNCLTSKFIVDTNNSSFGNGMVLNKSSFNFGGRKTMSRYINDIIDTASDPVITFMIATSSVTSELNYISI